MTKPAKQPQKPVSDRVLLSGIYQVRYITRWNEETGTLIRSINPKWRWYTPWRERVLVEREVRRRCIPSAKFYKAEAGADISRLCDALMRSDTLGIEV